MLVWLNAPVTLTEDTAGAEVPGLDTVTVCAALVEPDATSPERQARGRRVSARPAAPGLGKEVSTGVVLQPELPLPRLKVKAPGVYVPLS